MPSEEGDDSSEAFVAEQLTGSIDDGDDFWEASSGADVSDGELPVLVPQGCDISCSEVLRPPFARRCQDKSKPLSLRFAPIIEGPEEESSPFDSTGVVFLDWDDTLFPTWYVRSVVEPCTLGTKGMPLSEESPFYGPLRRHARIVEDTLRAARAVGRVAIVTLSQRPWVHTTAWQYLPGLDLPQLLTELDIPIFYAAEHVLCSVGRLARSRAGVGYMMQEGVDVQSACKYKAMRKFLREVCKDGPKHSVLSIGDSETDTKALQDLMWYSRSRRHWGLGAHCKTLKFAEDSTLEELGQQLLMVIAWLPKMMIFQEEFDI